MTLYEITEERRKIDFLLIESEGELTPEIEGLLTINAEQFASKAESYCQWLRDLDGDIAKFREEEKRIADRRRLLERRRERVKGSLQTAFEQFGKPKEELGTFTLSWRRSKRVSITDEGALPQEFIRITREADKAAIRDALKNGETVSGAELVEDRSMQIR